MPNKLALVMVCAMVSLVPLCGTNLITNGSFEANAGGGCVPGPPLGFVDLGPGTNCITGWSVVSGTVDYIDSADWQPESGNISIDMDGVDNGAIEQSFTTVPGAVYNVTFWLAGNSGAAPTIKTLQVAADGTASNYSFNTTGTTFTNMGWVQEAFNFTATGTTATLEFRSTDNPSTAGGPVLDNVTAAEAPEPGSLELAAAGIGLLVLSRLLRSRQSKKVKTANAGKLTESTTV